MVLYALIPSFDSNIFGRQIGDLPVMVLLFALCYLIYFCNGATGHEKAAWKARWAITAATGWCRCTVLND